MPLNPLTLTTNTINSKCLGSIQITTNNFRTCLRVKKLDLVNKNKNVIITPKSVFSANTFHEIRITRQLKAKNGSNLKNDIINTPGFRTSWSHQFGTSGNDSGIAISVDKKNNIYVSGLTSADKSDQRKDLFLTKFNKNGFQRWITQAGFDRNISSVILRINKYNKIFLSGYSKEKENSAMIIANYSLNGKKKFSKIISINGSSKGKGLTYDNEGNIYVAATTPFDILKLDEKGNIIRGIELSYGSEIHALGTDKKNNLYATGRINKLIDKKNPKKNYKNFLIKASQMGPKLWNKTHVSVMKEDTNSIAISDDKSIAITGAVTQIKNSPYIETNKKDAFVTKYSKEGKFEWIYIFQGRESEECTVSLWTSEGDLLVGGYTESNLEKGLHKGKEDSFLAKFNNDGNLLWLKQFGTEEHERPLGLGLDSEGGIYVTGFTEGEIDGAKYYGGRDIFIVKFNKNGIKQ